MNSNFFIEKYVFDTETIKSFSLIIDVRSPNEFKIDSIPTSLNFPVLNNLEREYIGKIYKEDKFKAKVVGCGYILKNIKKIIDDKRIDKKKKILIYCWRGGQRSLSLYLVLKSIGFNVQLLYKGYKGYRAFITNFFDSSILKYNFNVLSGLTGSGKTFFLKKLSKFRPVLDLESIANHKGSALGDIPKKKQPSQKKFESHICHQLSNLGKEKNIWVESESNRIGKLFLPNNLFKRMISGKIFNLIVPLKIRQEFILNDYKYLTKSSSQLENSINILKKFLVKKDYVDLVKALKNQNFNKLVQNLLQNHYDKLYHKRTHYNKSNILIDFKLNTINLIGFKNILESIKKLEKIKNI